MRVKRRYHPVLMLEDLQLARRNEKEKHIRDVTRQCVLRTP